MRRRYGGPQLSRQNTIHHGKIQFVTAKYNSSRQNTICHGKIQFITAKYNLSRQNTIHHGKIQFETTNSNYSRQTPNTHGKSKNNNCNSKFIKARAKHSRQKQIKNGGQRLMVSGCPSTWCSASQSTRRKHDVYFYLLKIRAAMFCYNCGFNINLADKFCSSGGKGKFSPLYNHSSGRGDVLGLFARVNSFYSLW